MSDADTSSKDFKDCAEDSKASQTDVSELVQTDSEEKVKKHFDTQGITINFYSAKYPPTKTDKPVQTEPSYPELLPKSSKVQNPKSKKLGCPASESREIRSFDYTPVSYKKPSVASYEARQNKLMNTRKCTDGKSGGRAVTELERKKLEAELKATEEIAKIQQAVIEKRLALELASLQDGNEYYPKNVTPKHSPPHADLRVIEEIKKKHNVAEDLDCKDWNAGQTRKQPLRPPPPRMPSNEGVKMLNLKSDSGFLKQNSSDLNPLRNFIEKKINLDKRSSRTSESKFSPSPTRSNSHDRRYSSSPEGRYSRKNINYYPPPDQPSCSYRNSKSYRARVLWKSAMTKIKKKMKHGPKGPEKWK